jgi:transcription antitermination factor NusG
MVSWYVVMSKPGKQEDAAKRLAMAGLEVFNPKMRQYSQRKGSYEIRALFPMYFFTKFGIEEHYKMIKYTRGVLRVLGTDKTPVPVEEDMVLRIKASCNSDNVIEAKYYEEDIKEGTKVTITDGPFAGIDAVVTGLLNDKQRVEVLMNLVKISIGKIQVKKRSGKAL